MYKFFVVFLSLFLVACGPGQPDLGSDFKFKKVTALSELGEDPVFEISHDGSLEDVYFTVKFFDDAGFFSYDDFFLENTPQHFLLFSLEDGEFLDVYNYLVDQEFHEIQTYEEIWDDRGGYSLAFRTDFADESFNYRLVNSSIFVVKDAYLDNFNNIIAKFEELFFEKYWVWKYSDQGLKESLGGNNANFHLYPKFNLPRSLTLDLSAVEDFNVESFSCYLEFKGHVLTSCSNPVRDYVEIYFLEEDLVLDLNASYFKVPDETKGVSQEGNGEGLEKVYTDQSFSLELDDSLMGKTLELSIENGELKFLEF